MAVTLRICLFDSAGSPPQAIRHPFQRLADVHIVGEFANWEKLQACITTGTIHVVAVNLDSTDLSGLSVVEHVAELAPNCSIVGLSRSNDPQTIIAAMRSGCAQFVAAPIDLDDLSAAIERIRVAHAPSAMESRRFCVVGSAGGAGATTLACNLATELCHATSQKCALIDLNLEFGDVSCAFDCAPKYSVADVCRDGVQVDRTLIESAMHDLNNGIVLLARPERVDDARIVTPEGVSDMFHVLGQVHPFVVADLPRNYSFMTSAAVQGADRVLIVTQLSVPHLRNAKRIHDCLIQMGAAEDRLEIVLNRCNANFERITPDEVARHFARPVFAIIPNDYRRVGASRDLGQPMLTDAPNSPARLAIQALARQLAGVDNKTEASGNSGLLGKLWKRGKPPAPPKPAT